MTIVPIHTWIPRSDVSAFAGMTEVARKWRREVRELRVAHRARFFSLQRCSANDAIEPYYVIFLPAILHYDKFSLAARADIDRYRGIDADKTTA